MNHKKKSFRSRWTAIAGAALLTAGIAAAGCSSSDNGSSSTTAAADSGGGGGQATGGLAKVYQEIKGLSGQKRTDKLIQLAKAEGDTLTLYTSDIAAVSNVADPQFTKETGVQVQRTVLGSPAILTKIAQEQQAAQPTDDVVLMTTQDLWSAATESLIAPLVSPVASQLQKSAVEPKFMLCCASPIVAAWNTTQVSGSQVPTSLTGLLKKSGLGFEASDWPWFATDVQWLEQHEHMTQDQAVDLFTQAAKNGRVVTGHTVLETLLNTGAFGIVADQFTSVADAAASSGAPVAWKPTFAPVFASSAGVAIATDAPHPAAALLYIEFRLTEGQKIAYEQSKLAGTNPSEAPTTAQVAGVPESDVVPLTKQLALTDRQKWQTLYNQVIAQAGH